MTASRHRQIQQSGRLIVCHDRDELAEQAAAFIASKVEQTIAGEGAFTLVLSGGSTPGPVYKLLAGNKLRYRIDWRWVHIIWGDERCVPPDDPESNYRLARETLLDTVPIPPQNVHRMHGEDEPGRAARQYENELRSLLGTCDKDGVMVPRKLDLALLGLGADAHTASLFPGTDALRVRDRWVAANYVSKRAASPRASAENVEDRWSSPGSGRSGQGGHKQAWRLTLTLPVLNAVRQVVFLAAGAGKAAALQEVLEGEYCPGQVPAQAVARRAADVVWFVDRDAAGELRRQ